MTTYKGVIFDMDGLLFDTEKLYFLANQAIAPKYGIHYDEAYYEGIVGLSDEETHERIRQDNPSVTEEELQAFAEEGYEAVEKLFEAGKADLKPGVKDLLAFLSEKKIPMVVASSNLRRFIDLLLEKAEIRSYFQTIVSCEDVKKAKPDPEIVVKAVQELGTRKEETLMLEDSKNGILASSAAGVPVIMVPDLVQPTEEIRQLVVDVCGTLHDVQAFF